MNEDKQTGLMPDEEFTKPCRDPGHNPPTHMVIPQGQKYVHRCPSCGEGCTLRSPQVFL